MEVTNPKYPTMLWASLMSDNEVFINNFLSKRGWSYRCFAQILKAHYATSVYHVAVGKSKRKAEHYDAAVKLILATAKDFWLYPCTSLRKDLLESLANISVDGKHPYGYFISKLLLTAVNPRLEFEKKYLDLEEKLADVSDEESEADAMDVEEEDEPGPSSPLSKKLSEACSADLVSLKKRLGGFYLLHTLYWKQPYQGLNYIIVDEKDLAAVKEFEADVKRLLPTKLQDEYTFMMTKLKYYQAFDFQAFADEYGIGYSTRNLLNAKYDNHVEILKLCKELQDELAHSSRIEAVQKKTMAYVENKKKILKTSDDDLDVILETEEAEPSLGLVNSDSSERASAWQEEAGAIAVRPPESGFMEVLQLTDTTVDEIAEVAQQLKVMGDVPMITRSALLGNEAADRHLTNEAQKRRTRMEVKEQKGNPAQRYDRDIFGSRKLKQPERFQKRGRSQTSMNLWAHYIPENYEFPKCPPPGGLLETDNAQQRGNAGTSASAAAGAAPSSSTPNKAQSSSTPKK